jgi:uncharacterized membrane protein
MQTTDLVSRWTIQTRSRVIIKTICYRMFMFLITALTALVVTGNLAEALSIGVATNAMKTFTYFGYEQLWSHITWGIDTSRSQ